jgi:5-methyltetrahydrofolate--homocysteine methyltransferase
LPLATAEEEAAPTVQTARQSRAGRPLPDHELEQGALEPAPTLEPPFWGPRVIEQLSPRALVPFLNEGVLFKFQWGYLKKQKSSEEHEEQLRTVVRPILHNLLRRAEDEAIFQPRAVYGWFRCRPEGDTLHVQREGGEEVLRFPRQAGPGGRSIPDYFRPEGDVVGLMAVTVGQRASEVARAWFEAHDYRNYLYLHGLSVELAEALAEYLHRQMRAELGISGGDARELQELFHGRYQGRRYAYGYPACPEMADQHKLLSLLGAERIGLLMDEDEQLFPEQSTAALVVHHPAARYFKV